MQAAQGSIARGLYIPLVWGSCCAPGSCVLNSLPQLLPRVNVFVILSVRDVHLALSPSHIEFIQFGQISDGLLGMSEEEL